MRGWSSMLVGFLLLGMAYWSFSADGFGFSTLLCAAAAAFFFFRGAQGQEAGETGDPTALIDFVRDPADAIVDTATDRLTDWLTPEAKGKDADKPGFDPDAAIARYLAQRPAEPPPANPVAPAPHRSFGRKAV